MASPDKLIFGVYRIKEESNRDAGRIIYKAVDYNNYTRVFLTRYLVDPALNKEIQIDRIKKILMKTEKVKCLNHPNIALLYQAGEFEGNYYTVSELVEGKELRRYLASKVILDLKISINIVIQILQALGHAHANGIIHGNLNPDNVILTSLSEIKIANFDAAESYSTRTTEYSIFNSNSTGYLSPEHFSDIHELSGKSDLFSASCILYQLVTGSMAYPAGDFESYIDKLSDESFVPVPPGHLNPDIPESLEIIILNGLCADPITRYQEVEEMITDLQAVLIQLDGGLKADVEKRFFYNIPEPEEKTSFHKQPVAGLLKLINSARGKINEKTESFAKKMGIISEDLILPIIDKKFIYTAAALVVIAMIAGVIMGITGNKNRQQKTDPPALTIAGINKTDTSPVPEAQKPTSVVDESQHENTSDSKTEPTPHPENVETPRITQGVIDIQSDIMDANIKIFNNNGTIYNEAEITKTPTGTTGISLAPGIYTVKILKDNYYPVIKREFLVESGKTAIITDLLTPMETLTIKTNKEARIYLDGKEVGRTDLNTTELLITGLEADKIYNITAKRSGHSDAVKIMKITEKGQHNKIELTLNPVPPPARHGSGTYSGTGTSGSSHRRYPTGNTGGGSINDPVTGE
jgi:serine/threonine protein kinase